MIEGCINPRHQAAARPQDGWRPAPPPSMPFILGNGRDEVTQPIIKLGTYLQLELGE